MLIISVTQEVLKDFTLHVNYVKKTVFNSNFILLTQENISFRHKTQLSVFLHIPDDT